MNLLTHLAQSPSLPWRIATCAIAVGAFFPALIDPHYTYSNLSHLCIPQSIYWSFECAIQRQPPALQISDPAPTWYHQPNTVALVRSVHTRASPLWEPHNGYGRDLWADLESMPFSVDKWLLYLYPQRYDISFDITLLFLHFISFFFIVELCILFHYSFFSSLFAASSYVFSSYSQLIFYLPEHTSYLLLPFVIYCLYISTHMRILGPFIRISCISTILFSGHPESSISLVILSYLFFLYHVRTKSLLSIFYICIFDIFLVTSVVFLTYLPALFLWSNSVTHVSSSRNNAALDKLIVSLFIHFFFGIIAPLHENTFLTAQALYLSRYQGAFTLLSPIFFVFFKISYGHKFILLFILTSLPIIIFRPWGILTSVYFQSYYAMAPFHLVNALAVAGIVDFLSIFTIDLKRIFHSFQLILFGFFAGVFSIYILLSFPQLVNFSYIYVFIKDQYKAFHPYLIPSNIYIFYLSLFFVINIVVIMFIFLKRKKNILYLNFILLIIHFCSLRYMQLIIVPAQPRIPVNILTENKEQNDLGFVLSLHNKGPYPGNTSSIFHVFDNKLSSSFRPCELELWSSLSASDVINNPCGNPDTARNNLEYSLNAPNAFLDISGVSTIYANGGSDSTRRSLVPAVYFTSAWQNNPTRLEPRSRVLVYRSIISDGPLVRINQSYDKKHNFDINSTCEESSTLLPHSLYSLNYTLTTECAGYFVRHQRNTPNWTVFVDGQKMIISTANFLFQSVYVTAGTHKLAFAYTPPGLILGFAISLIAQSALILYTIYQFRFNTVRLYLIYPTFVIFLLTVIFTVKIFLLGVAL